MTSSQGRDGGRAHEEATRLLEAGDSARLVMAHAQRARVAFDHRYLGIEHLFLGIVALDDPRLRERFAGAGADLDAAARRVREAAAGEIYPDGDYLGLTVRAQRVMARAERLAATVRPRSAPGNAVWAPHLLLAILAEEHGLPARALRSLGADLAALGESIRDLLMHEATEAGSPAPSGEEPQPASASSGPADERASVRRAAGSSAQVEPVRPPRMCDAAKAPEARFEIVAGPNDGFTFAFTDEGVAFEGEVLGPPPGSGLGPRDLDDVEVEIGDDGVALTCEVTFWLNGAEVTGTHLLHVGDIVRVGMTEMMFVGWRAHFC